MDHPQATTTLSDGRRMPWLGLGLWKVRRRQRLHEAVGAALQAGYRSLDTAAIYGNEKAVGTAIARFGLPRDELFITTKLWNGPHVRGRQSIHRACRKSLKRLGLDHVDLYLIHWPVPGKDRYVEAWQTLTELKAEGLVRSIGVSNFTIDHLKRLKKETGVLPVVNQVERHPWLSQLDLLEHCHREGIRVVAYSPLMAGHLGEVPTLKSLAEKRGKTPAQVVLRWHLQSGVVVIPKSVHAVRIRENAALFDFELSEDEMKQIDRLNQDRRFLPHPDRMNLRWP